jgi:hypothetical protein
MMGNQGGSGNAPALKPDEESTTPDGGACYDLPAAYKITAK